MSALGYYRCSKGHRWESMLFTHPYLRIRVRVDGYIVELTADPCPFCLIESVKALPQAEACGTEDGTP